MRCMPIRLLMIVFAFVAAAAFAGAEDSSECASNGGVFGAPPPAPHTNTQEMEFSLLQKDISMEKAMPLHHEGKHLQTLSRSNSIISLAPDDGFDNGVVALPPFGFVKTHKTASTTMRTILYKLASRRESRVMLLPSSRRDGSGWPGSFPGEDAVDRYGAPTHQFDAIMDHAVFNHEMYMAYLGQHPIFLTTLREPVSRAVSAFNFHELENSIVRELMENITDSTELEAILCERSPSYWEEHINHLEKFFNVSEVPSDVFFSRHYNGQAHDLGWYEFTRSIDRHAGLGLTTKYDNNQTIIRQWLDSLDLDFGHLGSITLTEYFDEGLVLLMERLQTEPQEVASLYSMGGQFKTEPSQDQLERLRTFQSVDLALYAHFNQTFWKYWEQGDAQDRQQQLAAVKLASSELTDDDREIETFFSKSEFEGLMPDWRTVYNFSLMDC